MKTRIASIESEPRVWSMELLVRAFVSAECTTCGHEERTGLIDGGCCSRIKSGRISKGVFAHTWVGSARHMGEWADSTTVVPRMLIHLSTRRAATRIIHRRWVYIRANSPLCDNTAS